MPLLPHAYLILVFKTNAWKAALRMQIVKEVSYFFNLFFYYSTYKTKVCIPKINVRILVEESKR